MNQNSGLRALWGLNDPRTPSANGQSDAFRLAFREATGPLSACLIALVGQAPADAVAALGRQQDALFDAYQQALDGTGPHPAAHAQSSVLEAAGSLAGSAAELLQQAELGQAAWQQAAALYAETSDSIDSLEAAGDPRAGPLRQALGEIDQAVAERTWDAAKSRLDDLAAKVGDPDTAQTGPETAPAGGGDPQPAGDPGEQSREFERRWRALRPNLREALATSRRFPTLASARQELIRVRDGVNASASNRTYEGALEQMTELERLVASYLQSARPDEARFQRRGREVAARLAAATADTRADTAREIAEGLNDEDLQFLPIAVRNQLMDAMSRRGFSDQEQAAVQRFYAERALDPAFEAVEAQQRDQLIDSLANDPSLAEARANWDDMNQDARIAVLERIAGHQLDAYGIAGEEGAQPLTIRPIDEDPVAGQGSAHITNAHYDHSTGAVAVNVNDHDRVAFNDFDQMLETITHEVGHRYQQILADRWVRNSPDLQPGSPLYEQALAFHFNRRTYVEADDPRGRQYYRNQPMEAQSRLSAAAIRQAVEAQVDQAAEE